MESQENSVTEEDEDDEDDEEEGDGDDDDRDEANEPEERSEKKQSSTRSRVLFTPTQTVRSCHVFVVRSWKCVSKNEFKPKSTISFYVGAQDAKIKLPDNTKSKQGLVSLDHRP